MVFDNRAFQAFEKQTVEETMNDFRKYIQPQLRKYGQRIRQQLESQIGSQNIPIHLARHIRRKVTLPFNTWIAIGGNGRGYKQFCHLQLGINAEYVFLTLSLIDHPRYEEEIVKSWMKHSKLISNLPSDVVFIYDHTQLPYTSLENVLLAEMYERTQHNKKSDILIGRILSKNNSILEDRKEFETWLDETIQILCPLFFVAYSIEQKSDNA